MMHVSKYQYFSYGKPEARSLKLAIDIEESVETKAENVVVPATKPPRSASLCFAVISRSESFVPDVSQEARRAIYHIA